MNIIKGAKIVVPNIVKTDKKWKGKHILDMEYFIMEILAKRRSGKTVLIYNMVKKFVTKKMVCLFFCSQFDKDPVYKSIRDFLDEKGVLYHNYTSIIDNGVDNVAIFMENVDQDYTLSENKKQKVAREDTLSETQPSKVKFGDEVEKKIKNKKPPKFKPIEFFIVFDDQSSELRAKSVEKLLKNSKHYKAKIILSSQGISDLTPNQHTQVDYSVLFKGFSHESIHKIYDKLQPRIEYDEFETLYKEITSKNHDFLLFDRGNESFRINLDKKLNLENFLISK